jgi:hypothetical protein
MICLEDTQRKENINDGRMGVKKKPRLDSALATVIKTNENLKGQNKKSVKSLQKDKNTLNSDAQKNREKSSFESLDTAQSRKEDFSFNDLDSVSSGYQSNSQFDSINSSKRGSKVGSRRGGSVGSGGTYNQLIMDSSELSESDIEEEEGESDTADDTEHSDHNNEEELTDDENDFKGKLFICTL